MPAPIVGGLIAFLQNNLDIVCWDGEVPRYDLSNRPINPDATGSPERWPVFKVYMTQGGFSRNETFEDPFDDQGEMLIQIWGVTRESVEDKMETVDDLLVQDLAWANINVGTLPDSNPPYVISMSLRRYYSGQEEGVRTADSQILYRGDMYYFTNVHGIKSRSIV